MLAWPGPLPRQQAVIRGDALVPAISAASILAKCFRDKLMRALARRYPGYGFERHKGYGVVEHLQALARYGPCRMHRMSFRNVRPDRMEQRNLLP
jgi:ribonuclease HII